MYTTQWENGVLSHIQILVAPKIWLSVPTQHNFSVIVPVFISDMVNKVWMSMFENSMYYIPCTV
jgi:hypothetical protein